MSNFEDIDEALTPEDHARVSEAARARLENVDLNKDADLPSLFWDTKIDDPDNADMAAMAALMDELTPKERAENYKNRGNACMQHGKNKYYLRNAEAFYTRALAEACEDKELDSICLSNRAQANILLGNNRKAFDDSKWAVKCNPANVKGYFRGAKSGIELKSFTEAISLCQEGIKRDPKNEDLKKLLETASKGVQKQWEDLKQMKQVKREMKQLFDALKQRGVQMGLDTYGSGGIKPMVGDDGCIHYRLTFLYPESMQRDIVEAASEETTLDDHLNQMFDPAAPPLEWDTNNDYTLARVELYYEKNATPMLSDNALMQFLLRGTAADEGMAETEEPKRWAKPEWVKVDTRQSLMQLVAQSGHVLPCHLVLHVVASGTAFQKEFVSGKWEQRWQ